MYSIVQHSKASNFLERAESWLMQSEAEYNLLLGLSRSLVHSKGDFEDPLFLATVELDGAIKGCAFRTPPYKFGLTQMPEDAIPALVKATQNIYDSLPAVLGPELVANKFAALWSEAKSIGFEEGLRQGIFQLDKVEFPSRMASGEMLKASHVHLDLVADWLSAFQKESGIQVVDSRKRAKILINAGKLFLWRERDNIVAMAGGTGATENGIRIGYVYTPVPQRGNGYATALTTILSQKYLDDGRKFCFLYTDLSNPISNGIYKKIGYRHIGDVVDYVFDRP